MRTDDYDLEESLQQAHQRFVIVDAPSRQAVVEHWQRRHPEDASHVAPARPGSALSGTALFQRLGVFVAVAASVIVLVLSSIFLSRESFALDDLPTQLVDVRSFRLRGYQYFSNPNAPDQPGIRLPIDYCVQRPGRFRHTFTGQSIHGDRQEITYGIRLCDGKRETFVMESEKRVASMPISELDAMLSTETLAQLMVVGMLIGPPERQFVKIGVEDVHGQKCAIYEGEIENDGIARIWFNPVTGWPAKVVHERRQAGGSKVKVMEIDRIEVNLPIDESLFAYVAPDDYSVQQADQTHETPAGIRDQSPGEVDLNAPEKLNPQPTSHSASGHLSLAVWHAFRVDENHALLVWRRSLPEQKEGGELDWLNQLTITVGGGVNAKPARHQWIQSTTRDDQWLWSLLSTPDGESLDRGLINLRLKNDRGDQCSDGTVALRFDDSTLRRLIAAAATQFALPEHRNPPEISLESVRHQIANE